MKPIIKSSLLNHVIFVKNIPHVGLQHSNVLIFLAFLRTTKGNLCLLLVFAQKQYSDIIFLQLKSSTSVPEINVKAFLNLRRSYRNCKHIPLLIFASLFLLFDNKNYQTMSPQFFSETFNRRIPCRYWNLHSQSVNWIFIFDNPPIRLLSNALAIIIEAEIGRTFWLRAWTNRSLAP